jgi:hypothetical protein
MKDACRIARAHLPASSPSTMGSDTAIRSVDMVRGIYASAAAKTTLTHPGAR